MKARYIIRLDDICPTMHWENFAKLEKIFDQYQIKPIIGIIPDNRDPTLTIDPAKNDFWYIMRGLVQKGWIIAQHGHTHQYSTKNGGLLNINNKSEFSTLPYQEQFEKIKAGKEILEKELGQDILWWMAPAHSFDKTTCQVLDALGFKYITDGIAIFPFRKYNLIWVPQQIWGPKPKLFGTWTICIHPNSIDTFFLEKLEKFLQGNHLFEFDLTPKETLFNKLYYYWWKFQYFLFKLLIKK